jgi:glycosyltransferase involved in cell wall biosynthesis
MSVGVPVVTSAGTSCAEVAGDAGLLVDPHDHAALAAALETACGPDGPRLAAASRARATEFSWAAAADQTLEVYRSVASRQRAATA